MNSLSDFIGLLMLILVAGPVWFVVCIKLFKWWDKRRKEKEDK